MTAFKSDFLRTLDERGLIHQISDPEELDAAACRGHRRPMSAIDATATSSISAT
jgi:tyrosyl-tRNA synthetase